MEVGKEVKMKDFVYITIWILILVSILVLIGICTACEIDEEPYDPWSRRVALINVQKLGCENVITEGGLDLRAACVANAKTCAEVEACFQRRIFLW